MASTRPDCGSTTRAIPPLAPLSVTALASAFSVTYWIFLSRERVTFCPLDAFVTTVPFGRRPAPGRPVGNRITGAPQDSTVVLELNSLQSIRIEPGKADYMARHLPVGIKPLGFLDKPDPVQIKLLDLLHQVGWHPPLQPGKIPVAVSASFPGFHRTSRERAPTSAATSLTLSMLRGSA